MNDTETVTMTKGEYDSLISAVIAEIVRRAKEYESVADRWRLRAEPELEKSALEAANATLDVAIYLRTGSWAEDDH